MTTEERSEHTQPSIRPERDSTTEIFFFILMVAAVSLALTDKKKKKTDFFRYPSRQQWLFDKALSNEMKDEIYGRAFKKNMDFLI